MAGLLAWALLFPPEIDTIANESSYPVQHTKIARRVSTRLWRALSSGYKQDIRLAKSWNRRCWLTLSLMWITSPSSTEFKSSFLPVNGVAEASFLDPSPFGTKGGILHLFALLNSAMINGTPYVWSRQHGLRTDFGHHFSKVSFVHNCAVPRVIDQNVLRFDFSIRWEIQITFELHLASPKSYKRLNKLLILSLVRKSLIVPFVVVPSRK